MIKYHKIGHKIGQSSTLKTKMEGSKQMIQFKLIKYMIILKKNYKEQDKVCGGSKRRTASPVRQNIK